MQLAKHPYSGFVSSSFGAKEIFSLACQVATAYFPLHSLSELQIARCLPVAGTIRITTIVYLSVEYRLAGCVTRIARTVIACRKTETPLFQLSILSLRQADTCSEADCFLFRPTGRALLDHGEECTTTLFSEKSTPTTCLLNRRNLGRSPTELVEVAWRLAG